MLLTIDIGNTNITLGCYKEDKLLFVSRMYTARHKTSDEFAVKLLEMFNLYGVSAHDFSGSIMSSVVPEITHTFSFAVKHLIGIEPLIVGEEYNGNLKVDVIPISYLGADLIAGVIGAIEKYPLPCLVADLGTATKILVIDKDGYFVGCTISPGVKISLDALAQKTALLPSVSFSMPEKAIGANTTECIQSGTVFGTAAMLDGLTGRIKKELCCENATVVATGGYSAGIIPCCETNILYDENLILDGLRVIYKKATE